MSAVAAALDLRAQGVLVGCFRPPSVPDGVSRLRVTARADLSGDDLYEAARLVARAAAIHGGAPDPATVEGPRAGDAPSPVGRGRRGCATTGTALATRVHPTARRR